MTITTATSQNESLLIGSKVANETRSTGEVIYCEFAGPVSAPLTNTKWLDDVANEFESDPDMARHLVEARQELSRTVYADEAETLTALRLAAGLSQSQLATAVGTSQPHVTRIERGQTDPSTDIIARIAAALRVDAARVFNAIRFQLLNANQTR